jgi:hypothetical protein
MSEFFSGLHDRTDALCALAEALPLGLAIQDDGTTTRILRGCVVLAEGPTPSEARAVLDRAYGQPVHAGMRAAEVARRIAARAGPSSENTPIQPDLGPWGGGFARNH